MELRRVLSLAVAAWTLAASPASADVRLVMSDGRVSIVAEDATVADILAEWARVGGTHFVNLDRMPGGGVITLALDVPEEEALELLLQSAAGYVAAPRAARESNLSRFDRVVIMPPSRTARDEDPPDAPPTPVPEPGAITAAPGGAPAFSALPRRPVRRPVPPPSSEGEQQPPAIVAPPLQAMPSAPSETASPVPGVIVLPPPPNKPRIRPGP